MKYKIGKTVAITLGRHKGKVVKITDHIKWRRRGI